MSASALQIRLRRIIRVQCFEVPGRLQFLPCTRAVSVYAAKFPRGLGHTRRSYHPAGPRVSASSKPYLGSLVATDLKFAIVIARFNDLVTKLLLEGALEAFDRHGGDRNEVDVS